LGVLHHSEIGSGVTITEMMVMYLCWT